MIWPLTSVGPLRCSIVDEPFVGVRLHDVAYTRCARLKVGGLTAPKNINKGVG